MENFHNSETDVVSFYECEQLVQQISEFNLDNYGSSKWLNQHEIISKLNLQAHINALTRGEEYVMESLSTFEKMPVLVHEAILTDIWKREILPKIITDVLKIPVKSYLALFHEAALLNLLEIVCFHKTALIVLEGNLIDLIEYCYDKMSILYVIGAKLYPLNLKVNEVLNSAQEFDKNMQKINFSVQISCVSIVRYISDHLNDVNISARSYLVNERDVMNVLVGLVESRPWIVNTPQGRYSFEENQFKLIKNEDFGKIPKVEGQVWLTIFNLVFGKESSQIFELTESRKNTLLKLKKYLNGTIIDQIPVLSQLKTFLDQISMTSFPVSQKTNPFIIAIVPQIKKRILEEMKLNKILENQKSEIWNISKMKNDKEFYKNIGEIYSHQLFPTQKEAHVMICANCGIEATKRCSRCKQVWYCGKECQIAHFKNIHKNVCKKIEAENESHLKEKSSALIPEKVKKVNFDDLD